MAPHNEAYELRVTGKEDNMNDVANRFPHHNTASDDKAEYGSKQRMPLIGANGENLVSVTRIRRLFSFPQIFAFSLTFMSTWEGMNT